MERVYIIGGYYPGTRIYRELGQYKHYGNAARYLPQWARRYEHCTIYRGYPW